MSWKLVEEVLDQAPADLSSGARLLLVVLAESARDDTRACWPGMDTITRRTGLSPRGVRAAFAHLAERGLDPRRSLGEDRNGRPVYAHESRRTEYVLPSFAQRGNPDASSTDASGGTAVPPLDARGGTPVPQRGNHSAAEAALQFPPSFMNPKEPGERPHPRQCERHQDGPSTAPCGACGDARRAYEERERYEATRRAKRLRTASRCPVDGHERELAATCPLCRSEHAGGDGWPAGTQHREAS